MIDEEWLKTLDFVSECLPAPDGTVGSVRIRGVAGLGANDIALAALAPDGQRLVFKARRHRLAFHINEIPLFLSGTPQYDVERVNRKLAKLVGNDSLDEMTQQYDLLFAAQLKVLYDAPDRSNRDLLAVLLPLIGMTITPSCPDAWPFLFCTPMMGRRLEEVASLPESDPSTHGSMSVGINVEDFRIRDSQQLLKEWAQALLHVRQQLLPTAPLSPATLSSNPLFVWGAAVMDGFFTDEELPAVVTFIEQRYGRLTTRPEAELFLNQIEAVASGLTCFSQSKVGRLMRLCRMLGFMFDVYDKDGNMVASSMRG